VVEKMITAFDLLAFSKLLLVRRHDTELVSRMTTVVFSCMAYIPFLARMLQKIDLENSMQLSVFM